MEKVPKRRTKYTRTGYQSPIEVALEVIGGKYKPVILYELRRGPQRYSDLRRAVKSATQKMLTQHLRELEQDGLVERRVFPQVPPRVQYCHAAWQEPATCVGGALQMGHEEAATTWDAAGRLSNVLIKGSMASGLS
jgi:DNA-binding HxlR family transcriptional regulator